MEIQPFDRNRPMTSSATANARSKAPSDVLQFITSILTVPEPGTLPLMAGGAIVGGIVSLVISRRITRGIDIVAGRADAIASGDLTGGELHLDSHDQIGSLATAMQQMQAALANIIGTVAQTAGSLTVSSTSHPSP